MTDLSRDGVVAKASAPAVLRSAIVACCLGLLMAATPGRSWAAETVLPVTPPGSTDTDQAFLPPPGLYGAVVGIPFNQNSAVYDTSGNRVPADHTLHVNLQLVVPALLYVYPFKPFGGSLASSIVLPFENITYSVGSSPGRTATNVADAFTDLLYWTKNVGLLGATPGPLPLSYGLSVGAGMALVWPTGEYNSKNLLNIGGNAWVIDPNVAFTYNTGPHLSFGDNTQVSARAFYGIPTENPKTRYHSGQVFDVDWSVTQQFGRFRVGAAGYYQTQLTADRPGDGASLPDGNRFTEAAAGPVLEYFFPKSGVFLKAKYQNTFYHRNFLDEQFLVVTVGFTL